MTKNCAAGFPGNANNHRIVERFSKSWSNVVIFCTVEHWYVAVDMRNMALVIQTLTIPHVSGSVQNDWHISALRPIGQDVHQSTNHGHYLGIVHRLGHCKQFSAGGKSLSLLRPQFGWNHSQTPKFTLQQICKIQWYHLAVFWKGGPRRPISSEYWSKRVLSSHQVTSLQHQSPPPLCPSLFQSKWKGSKSFLLLVVINVCIWTVSPNSWLQWACFSPQPVPCNGSFRFSDTIHALRCICLLGLGYTACFWRAIMKE